jgi:hypothetical protein
VSEPRRDFAAKYAGTCGTCEERFAVGDPIASTLVGAKRVFHHSHCVYGSEPGRGSGAAEARPTAPAIAPDACQATTKSGQPCRGGVKKGEIYCGPHLDQMARGGPPTRAPAADPVPGRPTAQDREGWDPF